MRQTNISEARFRWLQFRGKLVQPILSQYPINRISLAILTLLPRIDEDRYQKHDSYTPPYSSHVHGDTIKSNQGSHLSVKSTGSGLALIYRQIFPISHNPSSIPLTRWKSASELVPTVRHDKSMALRFWHCHCVRWRITHDDDYKNPSSPSWNPSF